jgi:hypothetical protein
VRPSIEGVRELQFEGFLLHAPDTVGEVSTQEWQGTFRADFNNGAYTDDDITDVFTQRITTPFHIYKNVFIPNGLYHFARRARIAVLRTISSNASAAITEEP